MRSLTTLVTAVSVTLGSGFAFALPPVQPSTELVTFLASKQGAAKATLSANGIGAVYGSLASRDTEPTTRDFVENFLITQGNVNILGANRVTGADLAYDNDLIISNGKFHVFTYIQTVDVEDDLPMHGGFIKVVVLTTGPTEKIVHIGSTLRHEPDGDIPNGTKAAQDALDTVAASPDYGHLTEFSTPEEVIYNPIVDTYHRAWRFRGWDDDEAYMFFVDTTTGDIIDALDMILDGDISGRVEGYATDGTAADTPTNPPVLKNLPGIEVTATGLPPVYATDDGSPNDGTYIIQNVPGPVTVSTLLDNQWVTVRSSTGSTFPDLVPIPPDRNVTPPATDQDFLFNDLTQQDHEQTSQVNAFLAINKTHDWFKALQENFTAIDLQLVCTVNIPTMCNANFVDNPPRIQSSIPENNDNLCNNSAFSTFLAHEYGHFILAGFVTSSFDPDPRLGSFQEGFADTVMSLVYDTPCWAENWYKPANLAYDPEEPCVRRMDAVAQNRTYKGFIEDECEPNGCEVQLGDDRCLGSGHCLGLALAGAFWDLRTEIGDEATERIFADFAAITTGVLDQAVLDDVLTVDDDDGNRTTASAHQQAIIDNFVLHGWEDPTDPSGLVVEWTGPPGDPVEGTDYTVIPNIYPPTVTLITTEVGGQAVLEWRIGRLLGGTEVANVGTVTTAWNGTAHDIRVKVGTDPATLCRNLYGIDIAAQSAAKYSDLALVLEGSLMGTAHCEASSADTGGLIIGSMVNAGTVSARGIGRGSNTPGDLVVSGQLTSAALETIPADSKLDVGRLDGGHSIDISGAMAGEILVQTDITGDVEVLGVFDGDICGTNLVTGLPLPENITLATLGPNATQCGGLLIYCDRRYTGPSGAWQDGGNWNGALPDETTIACIPADKTITVVSGSSPDVEAKAIHIAGATQSGSPGTLVLEDSTSLRIYDYSTVSGAIIMEHGSALEIANDLTIKGYGGEIDGSYDNGQTPPVIRNVGAGTETLTLAGGASLLVHGGLEIQVNLANDAYVVADDGEPLILSGQPKEGLANGYWIAKQDPVTQSVGQLDVDVEVTGGAAWRIEDHRDARITITAACYNLTGPVDLTNGTLDVKAYFWTSGDLTMQSVGTPLSAPVIEIASGKSTKFGN